MASTRLVALLALAAALPCGCDLKDPSRDEKVERGPSSATIASAKLAALPPEVRETLELIRAGGPFLHEKDGSVFGNLEHLLPERPRGYWKEYTVKTPGSSDRGARRIVVGAHGESYYTDDHYGSFRRIEE